MVNLQLGNSSSATPTQNTRARGPFGMNIAHETPKTRQAIKVAMVYFQALSQCWELTASGHSLAVSPVFFDDLWQVSITSEAAALENQVTCPWMKARLVKEFLHSSWLRATQATQSSDTCETRMWGNKSTRDHDMELWKFKSKSCPCLLWRMHIDVHAVTSVFKALGVP